jgi:hypothetical protein
MWSSSCQQPKNFEENTLRSKPPLWKHEFSCPLLNGILDEDLNALYQG